AEAPRLAEVLQRGAARGAGDVGLLAGGLLRAALPERRQEVVERELGRGRAGLHAALGGAGLAHVDGRHLPALDLGQVAHRLPHAAVRADQHGNASTVGTGASRPSSSSRARSARAASCRLCVTSTTAVSSSRASLKNNSATIVPLP